VDGLLHSLLRRQLKRHFGEGTDVPVAWRPFVAAVDEAYRQSDLDRTMIERSLDLSSAELGQANARMRQAVTELQDAHAALESRVADRTRELTVANETLRQASLEQQRLEAQLRQAHKMEAIGRLAGGIAHDFNNLLIVIFGQVEVLLNTMTDHSTRASIGEIQQAAESAALLTRQLLAFSRQQTLTPTTLDINDLVRNTNVLLRRLIGEDIDLVAHLEFNVGTVRADVGQLQQVLLNLGVNARDAMPHGGRLTITTSSQAFEHGVATMGADVKPGAYVVLTVTDTGVGMDADVKARVFEPFFTTKSLNQGTGLGLATAYGIVKQSGGSIDVVSELGQGTTVRVLLPRVRAPHARVAPSSRPATPSGAGSILVVEDQDAVRRVICGRLERAGYAVLEAENGRAALHVAAEAPHIDLLVTDIVMPHMNGRALAVQLAKLRPTLKVMYMTGYIDDADITRDIRDGAHVLLQKPFTAETLLQAVQAVLAAPLPAA
jgi:signal transduction histidine kinase